MKENLDFRFALTSEVEDAFFDYLAMGKDKTCSDAFLKALEDEMENRWTLQPNHNRLYEDANSPSITYSCHIDLADKFEKHMSFEGAALYVVHKRAQENVLCIVTGVNETPDKWGLECRYVDPMPF